MPGPFGAADSALAALGALDLDRMAPEELNEAVVAFQRLRAKLDAADARLLSRWDAEKAWRLDGAKTGAAWVAWRTHLPVEEARRRLRHARALRTLPDVADTWAAGDIDRAHVTSLLGACTPRTARDRTCFHPTCDEVPARPHIDHIIPASHGGPTTQINGRQGCDFHNLDRDPDTDPDPP